MGTAPPAVLLELHPILGVALILGADVVAPLAYIAGERDRGSLVGGHEVLALAIY
jgi:hypothetical protein